LADRRLVVDGEPFLVLACELFNSSASAPGLLAERVARVRALGANAVITPVTWDQAEPEEGAFDLSLARRVVEECRRQGLRCIPQWFGAWKNARSSYAPDWVVRDPGRFAPVRDAAARSLPNLSAFCAATVEADARAFGAVCEAFAEADPGLETVLMVQIENEVGTLGTARDHGPEAEAAHGRPVPSGLAALLAACADELRPQLRERLAGRTRTGPDTWAEAFGEGDAADELFQAWGCAAYVERLAQVAAEALPVPRFVNAWLESEDATARSGTHGGQRPGEYPSGGPQPHVAPVWRWATPHVDLLCPDIYEGDPARRCRAFAAASPKGLFVPEMDAARAPGLVCVAVGEGAIGTAPFGAEGLEADGPAATGLREVYEALGQLAPVLARDRVEAFGFTLTSADPTAHAEMGGFAVEVGPDRGAVSLLADSPAYGLLALDRDSGTWWGLGRGFASMFYVDGVRQLVRGAERGRLAAEGWECLQALNGDETDGARAWRLPARNPAFCDAPLSRAHLLPGPEADTVL
jgi:hypothetical protein